MTEEENKAIESLKTKIEFMGDNYYKIMGSQVFNDLRKETKVALNLIEKLQKEIEEKTIIIMAGAEKVKQLEKEFIIKQEVKENYIPKDKIRELIKEPTIITSDGDYISVKKVKKLLEEE